MMRKFKFITERTRTGYSAYVADDRYGIYTVGGTMKELHSNILEALNLYFEEKGKVFTRDNIKVVIDVPQLFEFYNGINVEFLGERIGMKQSLLMQFVTGKKQASEAQVNRILIGIRQLGMELSKIEMIG